MLYDARSKAHLVKDISGGQRERFPGLNVHSLRTQSVEKLSVGGKTGATGTCWKSSNP
jgi:hypothetical protein